MLILTLICQDLYAVPQMLSQQGRLIDSNETPVEGTHFLTFRMFDSNIATTPLWEETLSVSFSNGYYGATLGENINNPLNTELFSTNPIFLELQIDSEPPLFPRQLLSSTPYALRSGTAISVDGGTVNAAQLEIGGVVVVDSNGSWVGPTIDMNWSDLQGIPEGFADGVDNDTVLSESDVENFVTNGALDLAEGTTIGGQELQEAVSCQEGQVLRWDALVGWDCSEDSVLTSNDVLGYVTQNPIDLAASSSVAGKDIVSQNAPCSNGQILTYDFASSSWACGEDQDTNTQLSADEIVSLLTDRALQLASGTTVDGSAVLTESSTLDWNNLSNVPTEVSDSDNIIVDPGCTNEQVLQYNANTETWECIDFSSNLDKDGDGVFAWEDCDDNDADNANNSTQDADCDGVISSDDCDDYDPSNTTTNVDDQDCDGYLTSVDCDDNNPNSFDNNGVTSSCAATSCNDIKSNYPALSDGMYWLNIDSSIDQHYCDMTLDDGGWTLAKRISIDENSDNWFRNHPNFLNSVTGKSASKVMWKAYSDTSLSSVNGDDPIWAITTFATGSYTIDTAYQMTERGNNWRISNASRSNSINFYSVLGNVSCGQNDHVHIDYGSTSTKTEIASFYSCSWDGESSYGTYLLYAYTGHGGGGYFSQAYSNGTFTGNNTITAYEIFYK